MSSETRYEVLPCGVGSYGVYDNQDRRWVATGRQSQHDADTKLRQLALRQEPAEPRAREAQTRARTPRSTR